MRSKALNDLMRAFRQTLGNKVYMREVDAIFAKLNLTPEEESTVYYLIRDLNQLRNDCARAERNSRLGIKF